MTNEELKELISKGESDAVEFKLRLPPDHITASTLAAFVSSRGGILIIGVSDQGEIVGLSIDDTHETFERLQKLTSSLFTYPVEINTADLSGKTIVYVVVERLLPHSNIVTTSNGKIYIRLGSNNTEISVEQKEWIAAMRSSGMSQSLSMPTLEYIEKLEGALDPAIYKVKRRIFVAMSFREEQEPSLVDYYHAIQRAVERTGLPITLVRMDLLEGDFEISQQIMNEINNSDIVIVDFTLNASNVYFELGYARGRNKRIIQTARKDTSLEFDVRNWRTIFYRNATDLEEKLIPEVHVAYAQMANKDS